MLIMCALSLLLDVWNEDIEVDGLEVVMIDIEGDSSWDSSAFIPRCPVAQHIGNHHRVV